MKGNAQSYNTIAILFTGLTVFVCLCSLLMYIKAVQPPGFLRPKGEETQVPTLFYPSETPTLTPSRTLTPTRTPTFTLTPSLVPSQTPTRTPSVNPTLAIVETRDSLVATQTALAATPKK